MVKAGHCSGTSTYSLQVQRETPTSLSIDWGVDMARHKAGVAWKVTETVNGTAIVNRTVLTIGDGSFSITKTAPALRSNTVSASATNLTTGETCAASLTL
jgi:hypothetical protein